MCKLNVVDISLVFFCPLHFFFFFENLAHSIFIVRDMRFKIIEFWRLGKLGFEKWINGECGDILHTGMMPLVCVFFFFCFFFFCFCFFLGLICGLWRQKHKRPSFYKIPKIVTYLGCVCISGWKTVFRV